MSAGDWRDQWDAHASKASEKYQKMPIAELMNKIRSGKLDDYHVIWSAIGERGKLQEIGWELYDYLCSDNGYLSRYHCAGALLKLMKSNAFTQVELSAKHGDNLENNLKKFKAMLEEKIGPRK